MASITLQNLFDWQDKESTEFMLSCLKAYIVALSLWPTTRNGGVTEKFSQPINYSQVTFKLDEGTNMATSCNLPETCTQDRSNSRSLDVFRIMENLLSCKREDILRYKFIKYYTPVNTGENTLEYFCRSMKTALEQRLNDLTQGKKPTYRALLQLAIFYRDTEGTWFASSSMNKIHDKLIKWIENQVSSAKGNDDLTPQFRDTCLDACIDGDFIEAFLNKWSLEKTDIQLLVFHLGREHGVELTHNADEHKHKHKHLLLQFFTRIKNHLRNRDDDTSCADINTAISKYKAKHPDLFSDAAEVAFDAKYCERDTALQFN